MTTMFSKKISVRAIVFANKGQNAYTKFGIGNDVLDVETKKIEA